MPETKRHTNVTPEVSGSAKHEIYYGTNPATSEPIMIDRTSLSNTCEILCGPDVIIRMKLFFLIRSHAMESSVSTSEDRLFQFIRIQIFV